MWETEGQSPAQKVIRAPKRQLNSFNIDMSSPYQIIVTTRPQNFPYTKKEKKKAPNL
ncbi:hypothetical protein QJS04_geneDACA011116 [Acorus gramineus]|uniref:Uncharacterized protein n=1 Tax=Acorus gramineus TaxID=55184 RepID=A0AAV9BIB4_ACOGR|nr:hypothetical protein QJS04_geneDACA011116 [Acorus gramineus]